MFASMSFDPALRRVAAGVVLTGLAAFAPAGLSAAGRTVAEQTVICRSSAFDHDRGCCCGREHHHASRSEVRKNLTCTVNFEFDRAYLTDQAVSQLSVLAGELNDRQWADAKVLLFGNTDTVGSSSYNEGLSAMRADAVRQWLVANIGELTRDDVTAHALGESNPIEAPGRDDFRSHTNRRVVVEVRSSSRTYQKCSSGCTDDADCHLWRSDENNCCCVCGHCHRQHKLLFPTRQ